LELINRFVAPVILGLGLVCADVSATSAATFGTIPQDGASNEGVMPIFGTSSRGGWYGNTLTLVGQDVFLKIDFLGSESAGVNSFYFQGAELFRTTAGSNSFSNSGLSTKYFSGLSSGLLNFFFSGSSGTAANGSNPDGSLGILGINVGPNFFTTFDNGETSRGGKSFTLWFEDNNFEGGTGPDNDYDDMAVRITVSSVDLAPVPVPAAGFLMLGALCAFGLVKRRRSSV
jgi:hypothetical protein